MVFVGKVLVVTLSSVMIASTGYTRNVLIYVADYLLFPISDVTVALVLHVPLLASNTIMWLLALMSLIQLTLFVTLETTYVPAVVVSWPP